MPGVQGNGAIGLLTEWDTYRKAGLALVLERPNSERLQYAPGSSVSDHRQRRCQPILLIHSTRRQFDNPDVRELTKSADLREATDVERCVVEGQLALRHDGTKH